ncbi:MULTISPECIES: response regulator [unclassified Pseudomonas]|uniref:response regulator n=1 Tax=unclassified Pseudomonas TaxID=196821 RepID=UPI001CBE0640|nr:MULTISPECIES: response regulator [unclassified Pseudomonas]
MRILLAEDDLMIGSGLQKGLRQKGYTVDWVTDGKAAVLALETTSYALLLLDQGLPRQDDMEVLKVLRLHDETLPVMAAFCLSPPSALG